MRQESNQEVIAASVDSHDVPGHLKGLQVLAEGYQYYISYLKDGGDDGVSAIFGELFIEN